MTNGHKKSEEIARELFAQIERARDEAKSGGIVDEKIFNDRLNSMFAAGYMMGYVDRCLADGISEVGAKKQAVEGVFEAMFPGSGIDFIKTRVIARQEAPSIPREDDNYGAIAEQCRLFDAGMETAGDEVAKSVDESDYEPYRLKEYLLLGEAA